MTPIAALLLASMFVSAVEDQVVVRRFAFIAAANDGGDARPTLRYAVTDANALASLLEELGGVAPADRTLVVEPSRAELIAALDRLETQLVAARKDAARLELVFYYSGHSDERGLLLGEESLLYDELKSRLDGLSADVRIAILDSCASGAITRRKGGRHRPPFLVDASSQVKGYAVLTSSSENEAAQESDHIGASFFTHYLISGLRGAADVTTDGRVTLNEAYAFAFHETLRRTEKTLGGAQHAAYDIQLVGSGDLVMTDINATSATLGLPEALAGRVFVRDRSGRLVAELEKPVGRRIELGLAPGDYQVTLERERKYQRGALSLAEGRPVDLDPTTFEVIEGEATALRGGPEPDTVPFDFGVIPALSLNRDRRVHNYAALSLAWTDAYRLTGVAIAIAATTVDERMSGVQIASAFAQAGTVRGTQITGGVNVADLARGAQVTAGVNVAAEELVGLQISAGVNYASSFIGTQLGGLNVATAMKGAQVAAGLNYATSGLGAQLAIVNTAERFAGLQLGLVNIAGHASGLQLGLLNLSQSNDGESVGLLSYSIDDGILRPAIWTSDIGLLSGGIAIGTGHLYTLLFASAGMVHRSESWSTGLGLGVTIALAERWRLDIDVSSAAIWPDRSSSEPPDSLNTVRVRMGWRALDWLTVFAGPTYDILVDTDVIDEDARLAPSYAWSHGERVKSWIGWSLGVELLE